MNSKELLEQATAKATQLNNLANYISRMEEVLPDIRDKAIFINNYDISLRFGIEAAEKISQSVLLTLVTIKNEKESELEKLLGIRKPAIINPEFEAAVQEMERSAKLHPALEAVKKLVAETVPEPIEEFPDPVEEKLATIIKKQEQQIKDKSKASDTDIDKFAKELIGGTGDTYPAKKGGKKRLPEAMTDEAVYQMYVVEGKKAKQIADHYGLNSSQVSNYIFQHDIKHYGKKLKASTVKPAEMERP